VTDHFVDSSTYTNLETGRSYTTIARVTHGDVRITLVEGTIYEESIHEAGTFSVYDGDGALYYRQAGNQRIMLLVDTMGTPDGEDDQVLDFDYSAVGHFPGGDFCDDVQVLTS
jgi:hypothetical protein